MACTTTSRHPRTGLCLTVTTAALLTALVGCGAPHRADTDQPAAEINPAFELTHDAQDPSERDKELGYGRWKAKPEPEGTRSPTSPTRRRPD